MILLEENDKKNFKVKIFFRLLTSKKYLLALNLTEIFYIYKYNQSMKSIPVFKLHLPQSVKSKTHITLLT